MSRFEPFSDFELKELWYVLTRDECGWPIVFANDDKLRPLVEEMYAEAERRGIPASVDEYARRWDWDEPVTALAR